MKNLILIVLLSTVPHILSAQTQTTKQLTLSNGDGWYRVIEGNHSGKGMIRLWGTGGNNKSTGITMFISLMAYGQGGSLNIVDNLYYNSNHVAEFRAGTSNGKYVLDIKFENINNPTSVNIQADGPNLTILDIPIFGTIDEPTGLISISGKVIGVTSTKWPVYFSDKVGIGTTDPKSKLAVNGQIRATEVKVLADISVPDYVFEADYNLRSLKDTKDFIAVNKHLPEIPSASEIGENGIDLGDMNMKLLKKIEELTLHLIIQNEKLEAQQLRIEKLEKQK